jgi:hypothetical protein
MQVTGGRIVLYTLTAQDAEQINRRRTTGKAIAERIAKNTPDSSSWPIGAQAHIGNRVAAGYSYPMIITGGATGANRANGQVFLDGNDVLWVIGALEGEGPGTWAWPRW